MEQYQPFYFGLWCEAMNSVVYWFTPGFQRRNPSYEQINPDLCVNDSVSFVITDFCVIILRITENDKIAPNSIFTQKVVSDNDALQL